MAKISVKGTDVVLIKKGEEDYISLTDIAKVRDAENPSQIISLWLRTYNTIEYIGLWEMLNNPNFNPTFMRGLRWSQQSHIFGCLLKNGLLRLMQLG